VGYLETSVCGGLTLCIGLAAFLCDDLQSENADTPYGYAGSQALLQGDSLVTKTFL